MNFTWKILAGVTGLVTVVGGIFYLFQEEEVEKSPAKKQPPKKEVPKEKPIEKPAPPVPKPQMPPPQQAPKEQANSDFISKGEFINILKCIHDAASDKYQDLKKWFFETRRNTTSDEEYRKVMEDYKVKEQQATRSATEDTLASMGVSIDSYNQAFKIYANDKEAIELKAKIKSYINAASHPPDSLKPENLLDIFKFQEELLKGVEKDNDPMVNAINIARVDDQVFIRFGYESDEIIAAAFMYQQEVKSQWRKVSRLQQRLSNTIT